MRLKKLNPKGDTIIEVLIAVAVLSLILASSFNLATRSSKVTRAATERAEASKYAQSELERLKYLITQPGGSWVASIVVDDFFCIDPSDNSKVAVTGITDANIDTAYEIVDDKCKHGTDDRYATIIKRISDNGNANTYVVHTRWDSITGNGTDKIDLIHRIYPG